MNIGHNQTEFPRNYGVPMRGWDPQNPSTLTISLQLPEDNTVIWEGQVMTPSADGTKWQLGYSGSAAPSIVAFAQNSTLSTDVVSANNLVGLSCSGKFRVATPFFCRTAYSGSGTYSGADYSKFYVCEYPVGTKVTLCKQDEVDFISTPGNYSGGKCKAVSRSAAGFIRPAKSGEPVIGVVVSPLPDVGMNTKGESFVGTLNYNAAGCTQVSSGAITTAENNNYYMPNTGIVPLAHTWEDTIDSSAKLNNDYYLVIDTTYAPTMA